MRCLTFNSQQWHPIYDFRQSLPDVYEQIFVVGVMDSEILAIIMPPDAQAPHLTQKSHIKRFQFKAPFLDLQSSLVQGAGKKELTRPQLEQRIYGLQVVLDQETFRTENWESLRYFRSKYDNEHALSASICNKTQIQD